MKMKMLKRKVSALGLALLIMAASLIATPNVAVKSTETPITGIYQLNDENDPERS